MFIEIPEIKATEVNKNTALNFCLCSSIFQDKEMKLESSMKHTVCTYRYTTYYYTTTTTTQADPCMHACMRTHIV